MAGSENTTTLPSLGEPASTIYELGRLLGAIITESRRADEARAAGAPDLRADAREWANDATRDAIERLILAGKAASLADAAVHALHLRHIADDLHAAVHDGNDTAAQRALWTIERLARSIFDVLTQEAGIHEGEVAADFFLSPAERLWPATAAGDLFSSAVAVFEGEAGAMLQVPASPAAPMVDSVASSAGLSADVVRRVWGAMAGIARPAQEA